MSKEPKPGSNQLGATQYLELVDGMGKELAQVKKPAVLPDPCPPGRHCAHHGAGPFYCCLCGMEFEYAT